MGVSTLDRRELRDSPYSILGKCPRCNVTPLESRFSLYDTWNCIHCDFSFDTVWFVSDTYWIVSMPDNIYEQHISFDVLSPYDVTDDSIFYTFCCDRPIGECICDFSPLNYNYLDDIEKVIGIRARQFYESVDFSGNLQCLGCCHMASETCIPLRNAMREAYHSGLAPAVKLRGCKNFEDFDEFQQRVSVTTRDTVY